VSLRDAEVHEARPAGVGAWTFDVREGDEQGPVVAVVDLGGVLRPGEIRVGGVPFGLRREGLSQSYDLVFEELSVARADQAGVLSPTYELAVEAGLLESGRPSGAREPFRLTSSDFSRSRELTHEGRTVGEVTREAMFARHYRLRFEPEVPLVLRAFCLALLLVQLRRHSQS
jgi:hypothetical protein